MSSWLLAFVAMMPALATSERFLLGDCTNYDNKIDPISQTKVGLNILKKLGRGAGLTMIFWDASDLETDNRCMSLKFNLDFESYEFSYIDSTGARSKARGTAAFSMTPTARLLLSGGSNEGDHPNNVLSACPDGRSELFPVYISHKELLLIGCCNKFLGKRETLYVLTTEDVSKLNLKCARRTIRAATGRPVTAPSENCSDEG